MPENSDKYGSKPPGKTTVPSALVPFGAFPVPPKPQVLIVSSSGENIYPEEIESVINDFSHVIESLVVQQKGKLVAMVHLNIEELQAKYRSMKKEYSEKAEQMIDEYLEEVHRYVNSKVNKFSQVQLVVYQPEPFQKTATLKIKRFLYY